MRACPDRGLNPGRAWPIFWTMAALEQIIACSAATLAGGGGRLLSLGAEPVAVLSEPESTGALTARVGASTDLPTLLGMLTSVRPSGVLLLSSRDGERSLAIELDEGRVVGAVGPLEYQNMGEWVVELHRRHERARGSADGTDDAAVVRALRPGRAFLREIVLQALETCDEVGATMVLLEGDVQWLHERLEPEDTADFGFLLMELARRSDEGDALAREVGPSSAVVTPLSRPPERRRAGPSANSAPDFVDDPDPAASAEWLDARYVFAFCNGVLDVEGIIERTLLGRFRTLGALAALLDAGHVRLVDGREESAPSDELADLIAALV